MNKLLRYVAFAAVAAMPMVASAEIAGSGTAADPYQIATADDLCQAYTKVNANQTAGVYVTHFIQTADIDMSDVKEYYPVLGGAGNYQSAIVYDGQNYVISNFKPNFVAGYYKTAIFGVLNGELRNLGVIDAAIDTSSDDNQGAGILGAYLGQSATTEKSGYDKVVVENVYVTGSVKAGNKYAGGMFGTTGIGKVEMTNCFFIGSVSSPNAASGALIGRISNPTTMVHCYAAGTVGGSTALIAGGTSTLTANGVVALNTGNSTAFTGTLNGTISTDKADILSWGAFCDGAEIDGYPAFNPVPDADLTLSWCTPSAAGLQGTWTGNKAAPNWDSADAIMGVFAAAKGELAGKGSPNIRFATAKDGKIYTVNMATMYIAEITAEGTLKDLYKLPKPEIATEYYGTAISVDEAGNFLVGMNFLNQAGDATSASSKTFAVYEPASGKTTRYVIEGAETYRLDCVGRILGDLTKEAYFFLTGDNTSKGYAINNISIVKATADKMEVVKTVAIEEAVLTPQTYVQPAYQTLAEAGANKYDFYVASKNNYIASYIGGTLTENFAPYLKYTVYCPTLGFDTFVIGGKRYFVRQYAPTANNYMGVTILDEEGKTYCHWLNEDYSANGGFSTIVAEVRANGTAAIYDFNPGNSAGAAAKLIFNPAKAGEASDNIPVGAIEKPYQIKTAADLQGLAAAITCNPFYAEVVADIDMTNKKYTPVNTANYVYLEGNHHVISNLTGQADQYGLFLNFKGSIKNLGLENVDYTSGEWGLSGAFVAYAYDATVENCYSTGIIRGFYAGGIVAGVQGGAAYTATIKNCWSSCTITNAGKTSNAGGIVGGTNAQSITVIDHCLFRGEILAASNAAGIYAGAGTACTATISDVVVMSESIASSGAANAIAPSAYGPFENAYIWEESILNGQHPTDGKTLAELQATVTAWEGFNDKLHQGYPVLAWQEADGVVNPNIDNTIYGTEEHPFVIKEAADFGHLATTEAKLKANVEGATTFYVELGEDIDMLGKAYTPFTPSMTVNFDGKNHVISDLSMNVNGGNLGLFTEFQGTIKNLGMVDASISAGTNAWGDAGVIIGYVKGEATIENCYAQGCVTEGFYAGGLVAGVRDNAAYKLTVKNCHVTEGIVMGPNGFAGGLVGPTNQFATTIIEGSFIKDSYVEGNSLGGAIATLNSNYDNHSTVVIKNSAVIATEATVKSVSGEASEDLAWKANNDGAIANVSLYNVTVGGTDKTNVTLHELQGEMLSWGGLNTKLHDGFAVLAWQDANGQGFENAPVYVATEEDGEYALLEDDEVNISEGTVYVKIGAHSYFTTKHKFTAAAAAAVALEDNDGYAEYSEPIVIATNGTLHITVADANHSAERTISFSGQSGIEDITVEAADAENAEYYNLQGVKVANPANGVYVRVAGGKATKVAK